jgi:hypothetical protein
MPTASTCYNILHFPPYEDAAIVESKLRTAILNADASFDLK